MRRATILIVEDDAILRSLISEVVAELGYRVLAAPDTAGAIELLQDPEPIGLLITDVNLPGGLDGGVLARRARKTRPDLKVMFITGHSDQEVLRGLSDDPPTVLLRKPFSMRELTGTIHAMRNGTAP